MIGACRVVKRKKEKEKKNFFAVAAYCKIQATPYPQYRFLHSHEEEHAESWRWGEIPRYFLFFDSNQAPEGIN